MTLLSPPRVSDRAALRRGRAIVRSRAGRPAAEDAWYRIYLSVLVLGVVVFPVVRAAVLGLALPEAVVALGDAMTPARLAAVLAVATALLHAAGRSRGPVVPTEPYVDSIVASALARRWTLRRPLRGGVTMAVAIVLLPAALFLGASAVPGALDPWGVVILGLGCAAFGVLLAAAWLAGQWPERARRPVSLAIAVAVGTQVAVAFLPSAAAVADWLSPWGWIGSLSDVLDGVSVEHVVAAGLLLGSALVAVRFFPAMLERLDRDDLAAQAARWNAVFSLSLTGDSGAATRRLAAAPRRGRRWAGIRIAGIVGAVVARDLLGVARFPIRSAVAGVGTVGTGAVIAAGVAEGGTLQLLAGVAAAAMYVTVGPWCGGLRMFAATLGGSSAYGVSPAVQTVSHLLVPAVLAAGASVLGAGISVAVVGSGPGPLVWSVLVALLALALHLLTAVKGPLPVGLRMPVPTPLGDLSIVAVALWVGDAVVLMAVFGGGLTLFVAATSEYVVAAIGLAVVGIVVGLWASARFARLLRTW